MVKGSGRIGRLTIATLIEPLVASWEYFLFLCFYGREKSWVVQEVCWDLLPTHGTPLALVCHTLWEEHGRCGWDVLNVAVT